MQYSPHVFVTRTQARKLRLIHILKTTPTLGAALHHYSQPPRRRTRMDRPSSSSLTEQATLAQFAPPDKFHVSTESVVGDVTVPGSYLHSAFVVQSGSNEDNV